MRLSNVVLLNAGDASGNLTSTAGLIAHVFGFNIQIVITGSPVGVLKLQGSSDPVPDAQFPPSGNWVPTNWTDIKDSSVNVTGAGTVDYDVGDAFFNFVRVVYSSSSGTGTMTIRMNAKGF